MGSIGFGEIAIIAIIALLVFGPDRLPELSRKAGELMAKAREATRSFTDAIDNEFDETTAPIRSLKAEYQATKDELASAAGTVFDLDTVMGTIDTPKPDTSKSDITETPSRTKEGGDEPVDEDAE
jgi:sec-independent protein translocase protein TatB